ncbi:hypothetical protein GUITHDRAFT_150492 [Guillardia theta CCMP2712]|uniref:Uncharacterized protein n=1 Tax=Guillardia theta (strain CCMP2712) TaxID=905079 RepID=L1JXA3_GUITC|nr:hypothetical protein GUITHDRAFT_150492 [Guillardia theta CCMP2712]EKX52992.1 hypothetical protein GUITHDRAFT_150492 [Guillardia theta CCMP2712]|eukprot:XP_005839972.1 hypothetical protein GUITHDRAFT_150492 [Guillardia theta CCMP2712]
MADERSIRPAGEGVRRLHAGLDPRTGGVYVDEDSDDLFSRHVSCKFLYTGFALIVGHRKSSFSCFVDMDTEMCRMREMILRGMMKRICQLKMMYE